MDHPNQTSSRFESLPSELRQLIYEHTLVKSSPIVVWAASLRRPTDDRYCSRRKYHWDHEAMSQSREGLLLSLFRVNFVIGTEAQQVFYSRNTFSFCGDHDWIPIISWLNTIGDYNRDFLRSLTVGIPQPTRTWQWSDGSRAPSESLHHDDNFWPRNGCLSIGENDFEKGEVENINPALETFIAMLARTWDKKQETPALVLTFIPDDNLVPGVVLLGPRTRSDPDDDQDYRDIARQRGIDRYLSMDMPNLVEKWARDYRIQRGSRELDIRWQVRTEDVRMEEKRAWMRKIGWQIMSEGERVQDAWAMIGDPPQPAGPWAWMIQFVLKREKELIRLMRISPPAADPMPDDFDIGVQH
ncbi:MAG: hypothetical protein M1821_005843 [Bathelium mastoideum]|nr:MAG: hypothetical protein M1821_005843 [Bathelium mastoideum]